MAVGRCNVLSRRGWTSISVVTMECIIESRTYQAKQAAFTGGCSRRRRGCMFDVLRLVGGARRCSVNLYRYGEPAFRMPPHFSVSV